MTLAYASSPSPLHRLGMVNACSPEGGTIYASGEGRVLFWGDSEPAAADYPAPGSVWVDTNNALLKYNSGTMASPTWSSVSGAAATLDTAFDAGQTIDSAATGKRLTIGDGTDTLQIYAATNMIHIVTGASTSAGITIAPDSGATTITGTLALSSDFAINTNKFTVTASSGNTVVAGTLGVTGDVAVNTNKFTVTASSGNTVVAGTLGVTGDVAVNTNKFTVTASSGNTLAAGTLDCTGNFAVNTNKFTADATSGDVAVAGNLAVTGTITGTYSISSLSASTLTFTATSASGTGVTVNGNSLTDGIVLGLSGDGLTSGKFISADVASSEKFSVGFDGRTTIAGTAAANVLVVTAGDMALSDGSITLTDGDNATSFSVTNNTITSGNLAVLAASAAITGIGLYLNLAGLTTGKGLSVAVPALTSGAGVYVSATEGAGLTGKYIQCYDGAADDFSVSRHGATVITGSAGGTAALTLSAGDVVLSSGRLNVTSTTDVANSLVRSVASAGTDPVLTIQASNASSTKECLFINADGTGGSLAMQIDHEGTGDCLTIASKAASASVIKASAEAATGTILELAGAANSTVSLVLVDGATADWVGASGVGMVQLTAGTTVLAHAAASLFLIANTAQPANSPTAGVCIDIADTGAAAGAGTAYQLHITSTNNEALWVQSGTSLFSEAVTVAALLTVGSGSAAGVVQSNGNYDVTLQTGNATTGTITITDGANGNITVTPNGSGRIACVGQAVAADSMQDYVPKVYRYAWEHTDPDGNNDITLINAASPKMHVINAWLDMDTAEGGPMTITLRDTAAGGGNAICGTMDANVTGVDFTDSITTPALAAGSSIFANFSGNPGTAAGTIYLLYVETA